MKPLDDIVRAVADLMQIDAEQAERRKAFLELEERDQEILRDLHQRLGSRRLDFIDQFYEHLMAFRETRSLIQDPQALARLKRSQTLYFERLTAGTYDWDYIANRLRVGVAHQRVGLNPQWYIGAYRKYLCWLLPAVWELFQSDPGRAIDVYRSLIKVVFLDMGLAIDTYIHADREALRTAKAYGEQLIASIPSGLMMLDESLRVVLVNRSFVESFNIGVADVAGRLVTDLLPANGLSEQALKVMTTGESRYGLPFELRGSKYGTRSLRITIARIKMAQDQAKEEQARLLLVIEDLTEEERLRTRARASEVRFREVVENATDSIVMMDEQGLITYFNRAAEEMFGYRRDQAIGQPVTRLMPKKFRALHNQGTHRYLSSGESRLLGKVRQIEGLHSSGKTIPIECTVSACRIDNQIVFTGMLRDISGRLQAEEALRRSERSFRSLIEQSPDAIAVHRDNRFVYVNPSMVRLLGYSSQAELMGSSVATIVHPKDRPAVADRIRNMITTGKLAPPREERLLRKDGSIIYAEVAAMPIEYEGKPAAVSIGRDLTERKVLAARMMRMDRMIAVGTLAAGVGHEINNPLTYVSGNVNLAFERLGELRSFANSIAVQLRERFGEAVAQEILQTADEARARATFIDLRKMLRDACHGSDRIRDIVSDLKTFSRGDKEERKTLQVQQVVSSAVDMAFNEIRHRARLVKEYSELPPVYGNESQLGQVFLNLLVNAAHAIEEGAADRNQISIRTSLRGQEIAVEIRDTGKGIPAKDLPKLFDPFFTTKPVGQGIGLGLSICRQILERHGGRIEVESKPGKGSLFRVLLPATSEKPRPAAQPPKEPLAPARRGRILIVDDEPLITRNMQLTLGDEHTVETVTTARKALDLIEAGEHFDLIFCDLMMPDMTGMDLFETLQHTHREQARRTVFMTGGAFTSRTREFLERTSNLHIEKPFKAERLRALVRSLLLEDGPPHEQQAT